jgi:cholesterol transport system auxiliary component
MIRPLLRFAAPRVLLGVLCAVALTGCISLLPKSKPAQLYRFSVASTATVPPKPGAVAVFLTNGKFQEESAGDRILTVNGGKAAYVADSRWVAPAEVLFDETVSRAFDSSPVRLLARGQQGRAAYALRLDVRNFEARYAAGSNTAPTVVVHLHAALVRSDQSSVGEQEFEAQVAAGDNRVGDIVSAYDKAVGQVIGKLVAWTQANAT